MKKNKSLMLMSILLMVVFVFSTTAFAAPDSMTQPSTTDTQIDDDNDIDDVDMIDDDSADDVNDVKPEQVPNSMNEDNDADDIVTKTFIVELSNYFGIAEADVEKLNTIDSEQGEMFFTCYFAKETKKSTSEIAQLKNEGIGWGEIAKANNLEPGSHGRAMGKFRSGK